WQTWTQLMGVLLKEAGAEEHQNSMPAVCAHVTDYARMRLWQMIKIVGRENVVYCDTDCLIVPSKAVGRLQSFLNPTALGKLKIEGTTTDLVIHGPKDYVWGGERVLKGIRSNATQIDDTTFEQALFPGLNSLLGGVEEGMIPITEITKRIDRTYRKGTVQAGGFVSPFALVSSAI
ncbi:unnamed protein product, partial [marine sediment metagenome]